MVLAVPFSLEYVKRFIEKKKMNINHLILE